MSAGVWAIWPVLRTQTAHDPKYAKWRYDDLPILPEHWQMVVGKDKKKQFDILKKLMTPRM